MVEMPQLGRAGRLPSDVRWQIGTLQAFCVAGEHTLHSLLVRLVMSSVGMPLEGLSRACYPSCLLHNLILLTVSTTLATYVVCSAVYMYLLDSILRPDSRCTRNSPISTSIPRGMVVNTPSKWDSAGRTVSCCGLQPTMVKYLSPLSAPHLSLPRRAGARDYSRPP